MQKTPPAEAIWMGSLSWASLLGLSSDVIAWLWLSWSEAIVPRVEGDQKMTPGVLLKKPSVKD